jgi:hypothetical protein
LRRLEVFTRISQVCIVPSRKDGVEQTTSPNNAIKDCLEGKPFAGKQA